MEGRSTYCYWCAPQCRGLQVYWRRSVAARPGGSTDPTARRSLQRCSGPLISPSGGVGAACRAAGWDRAETKCGGLGGTACPEHGVQRAHIPMHGIHPLGRRKGAEGRGVYTRQPRETRHAVAMVDSVRKRRRERMRVPLHQNDKPKDVAERVGAIPVHMTPARIGEGFGLDRVAADGARCGRSSVESMLGRGGRAALDVAAPKRLCRGRRGRGGAHGRSAPRGVHPRPLSALPKGGHTNSSARTPFPSASGMRVMSAFDPEKAYSTAISTAKTQRAEFYRNGRPRSNRRGNVLTLSS